MWDRLRFLLKRLGERLWIKPLFMALVSTALVFLARMADTTSLGDFVPEVTTESIETLLKIISASMLVIATFSVASMVSAYASAGSTATPRSFSLIISDDVSQNALSTFIGAFIFSIVSLVALQNSFYDKAGRFALFALTLLFFAVVITTFVRWVDSIARLGRLATTIDKAEAATAVALKRRRAAPTLGGVPVSLHQDSGQPIHGTSIGYVQRVDVSELQKFGEDFGVRFRVAALPGTFSAPGRVLAYVRSDSGDLSAVDTRQAAQAFRINASRTFDEDPRFGLIVLSEIASRALSPAVNDPGTAIDVIGRFVRLFAGWSEPIEHGKKQTPECDRVEVPEVTLGDMFNDAFGAIARDGAGAIEVAVRLQKALHSLASIADVKMQDAAMHQSRVALARAENALELQEDLEVVRAAAKFSKAA